MKIRDSRRGLCAVALAISSLTAAAEGAAQTVPPPGTPAAQVQQQITGLGMRQMVRSRIQTSGMSAEQIRSRLASMGYDPRMLDPYMSDSESAPPEPGTGALAAVRALGMVQTDAPATVEVRPDPAPPTDEERRKGLRVFGVDVFTRGSSEFEPVVAAALPTTYTLGPGDEIVLTITGDVEYSYVLPVSREGTILIPQVGQVAVNGVTLAGLREHLYSRLGRVYSGVSRNAGATTQFDVSIARTRTNQIFITGEVSRPGSYTVSPLASVLNALYQAGGPTGNGNFREVQVMRGSRAAYTVDLYRYLLGGDNLANIRLEPGDVIFVGVHGRHVSITGEVTREAIYELKDDENLAHLIAYAGGLTAPAQTRRARITRILSPDERRQPGVDRVVMDVDLDRALRAPGSAIQLRAGDAVQVFAVQGEVRNSVSLNGSVWRDGTYGYRSGMRVWDLIGEGEGLREDAYLQTAYITRLDRATGMLTMIPFSLERNPAGDPVDNPVLTEDDIVRVLSRADREDNLPVDVVGAVRRAQTQRYERNLFLRDAIIRAGGLTRFADPVVEISRLASPAEREAGRIARIFKVRLDSTYFISEEAYEYYLGDPTELSKVVGGGEAAQFQLQPNDRIFVRTLSELEMPRIVAISGEVKFPGTYTLLSKQERVRDAIINRAGGLTNNANPAGFRLVRNGNVVDVDLARVLADPSREDNLILLPGDALAVPEYDPIVQIRGAVNAPTAIVFREGEDMSYYIKNAGGLARHADDDRIYIEYPSGRKDVVRNNFYFLKSTPHVEPGSVITVPLVPSDARTDVRGLIADIVQIAASLATVGLVVYRLK